jgi:aspartyl-tRNA(Asn)/glutamyl-tRNA(Gln) amidotransferase subunit C
VTILRDEVLRIAALARLEVREDELDRTAAELGAVLDYARALQRLDLSGCEPLRFAPPEAGLRADAPDGRRLEPGEALSMAPATAEGCFVVPPVVETPEP